MQFWIKDMSFIKNFPMFAKGTSDKVTTAIKDL